MAEINYEGMMEAGVHIGHQKKRWNPKFKDYLYKHIHGLSVIDLEQTKTCLESAAQFLTAQVKEGATLLFAGTKQQAQEVVREIAKAVEMPFCVNRWLGGCLTNFETVKASLLKYQRFLQMEESGELARLPKKEGAVIRRTMVRMQRGFEGIINLTRRPDVLVVVDVKHEMIAVQEANRLQIPVVGIVDTNSDPSLVDFPIPANDDSTKSLSLILDYLKEAILQGIELHALNKSSQKDVPVNSRPRMKSGSSRPTDGKIESQRASRASKRENGAKRLANAESSEHIEVVQEKPEGEATEFSSVEKAEQAEA